jgi:eukaryotic-like serine/threonine-protein kinase
MSLTSSMLLDRRYELEERIGAGGFSEVWRATDRVLGRPVAIKMLHPEYACDAEVRERFRAEARHAGSLAHENIARVYDYGEPGPGNPAFLVMELVAGPSLAQVLAGGPLDPARSMRIVAQAASALHAAHAAGLMHRDIKPGNLLLAPGDAVKVTDFGIAHAAGSAPVTVTGIVMGTPGYLAPERAAGMRGTSASDMYALGVVAYECLAGAAPLPRDQGEAVLAQANLPIPPLPASVPAAAAMLVMELTARDPGARPSAADASRRAAQAGGSGGAWTVPDAAGLAGGPGFAGAPDLAGGRDLAGGPDFAGGPGPSGAHAPTRALTLLPPSLSPPGRHVARARHARGLIVAGAMLTGVIAAVTLASVIGSAPPQRPVPVPSSSQPAKTAARPAAESGSPHGRHPSGEGHGNGHGHHHGHGNGNGNGNEG